MPDHDLDALGRAFAPEATSAVAMNRDSSPGGVAWARTGAFYTQQRAGLITWLVRLRLESLGVSAPFGYRATYPWTPSELAGIYHPGAGCASAFRRCRACGFPERAKKDATEACWTCGVRYEPVWPDVLACVWKEEYALFACTLAGSVFLGGLFWWVYLFKWAYWALYIG